MFDAVVPEVIRPLPSTDGHAVIEGVDDLPAAAIVFEPADVRRSRSGTRNTDGTAASSTMGQFLRPIASTSPAARLAPMQ